MANMGDVISEVEVKLRSKELETELRKAELESELQKAQITAQLGKNGLQGALMGALACGVVVLALAGIGAWSDRSYIYGWHLTIILVTVIIASTAYGAFVFNRSLSFKGALEGVSAETGGARHSTNPQAPGTSGQ